MFLDIIKVVMITSGLFSVGMLIGLIIVFLMIKARTDMVEEGDKMAFWSLFGMHLGCLVIFGTQIYRFMVAISIPFSGFLWLYPIGYLIFVVALAYWIAFVAKSYYTRKYSKDIGKKSINPKPIDRNKES